MQRVENSGLWVIPILIVEDTRWVKVEFEEANERVKCPKGGKPCCCPSLLILGINSNANVLYPSVRDLKCAHVAIAVASW